MLQTKVTNFSGADEDEPEDAAGSVDMEEDSNSASTDSALSSSACAPATRRRSTNASRLHADAFEESDDPDDDEEDMEDVCFFLHLFCVSSGRIYCFQAASSVMSSSMSSSSSSSSSISSGSSSSSAVLPSRPQSSRLNSLLANENLRIMRFVDRLSETEQDAFDEWLEDAATSSAAECNDVASYLRQQHGGRVPVLSQFPHLASSSSSSLSASSQSSLPSLSSSLQDPVQKEPQFVTDAFFAVSQYRARHMKQCALSSFLVYFVGICRCLRKIQP